LDIFPKHPPKTTIQEFVQTALPTFGPSVCCKRFCSISPNQFGHFSKTSPKNDHPRIRANGFANFWTIRLLQTILLHLTESIWTFFQNIPQKRPSKNSRKRLCQLLDHLLENYKKSDWTFFQNIPQKRPSKNSRKLPSQHSRPFLYFFAGLQIRSIMVCT